MIQEQVPSAVCSARAFVYMCVYGYIAVSVTVRECVFSCTSSRTYIYIFFFAHVDALVCLAKRSDVCLAHLWSGWRSRGRWDMPGPRGSSCVLKGIEECHHRQTCCELWNNRRTTEINTVCPCYPTQKKSQSKILKESEPGRKRGKEKKNITRV